MIKTALTTIINTLLGSGTNITATELRSVQADLLTNAYGTIVNDTHLTTNVLTASDAVDFQYDLNVVKQGRFVNISGTLVKPTPSMVGDAEWLTITNSEYLPSSVHFFSGITSTGSVIKLSLQPTGELFLDSAIAGGEVIYIETIYNTVA